MSDVDWSAGEASKLKRGREDVSGTGFNVEIRKSYEHYDVKFAADDEPYIPYVPSSEPGFNTDDAEFLALHGLDAPDVTWVTTSVVNHENLMTNDLVPELITESFAIPPSIASNFQDSAFSQTSISGPSYSQAPYSNENEMAGKAKRSKTGSSSRKKKSSRTLSPHLVGYLNPFVDTEAVIPDAKASQSLAARHTTVTEMAIPDGRIGHILMWPGLNGGLIHFNTLPNGTSRSAFTTVRFPNSKTCHVSGSNFVPDPLVGGRAEIYTASLLQPAGDIAKWRTVSHGLRMAPITPNDSMGGWFETCNLHYKMKVADWEIFSPQGNHTGSFNSTTGANYYAITGEEAIVRPDWSVIQNLLNASEVSLAETDGYRLGTLKSIASTAFTLQTFDGDHEFSMQDENYRIDAPNLSWKPDQLPPNSTLDYNLQLNFLTAGTNDAKDFITSQLDSTHDLKYIRLRPILSGFGSSDTKFLLQQVANHEYVYETGSELFKLMVDTPPVDKMLEDAKFEKSDS